MQYVDNFACNNLHLWYTIYMKDTNIRVLQKHHKLLVKLAKKEGRTIKATFGFIIDNVWKNSSSI